MVAIPLLEGCSQLGLEVGKLLLQRFLTLDASPTCWLWGRCCAAQEFAQWAANGLWCLGVERWGAARDPYLSPRSSVCVLRIQ